MRTQATQVATNLAGQLIVYVLFPLIVASILGAVAWAISLNRKMRTQDLSLALLIQQVSPPGSPALRDLVHAHALELAQLKGEVALAELVRGRVRPRPPENPGGAP